MRTSPSHAPSLFAKIKLKKIRNLSNLTDNFIFKILGYGGS